MQRSAALGGMKKSRAPRSASILSATQWKQIECTFTPNGNAVRLELVLGKKVIGDWEVLVDDVRVVRQAKK